MSIILHDKAYDVAMANCSPMVKRFIERLDAGDKLVQWSLLEKNGLVKGGVAFKITSSWRSMKEQIDDYKKGRSIVMEVNRAPYNNPYPFQGVQYVLKESKVTDSTKVVTQLFGGRSRHNYGMAVDIIFNKIGWQTDNISFNGAKVDVKQIFKESGLPLLAIDCGLNWGGNWSDLYDPYHFEDVSVPIPPLDDYIYNYDDNCNYDFAVYALKHIASMPKPPAGTVSTASGVSSDSGLVQSDDKKSVIATSTKVCSIFALLVGAYITYKIIKG